MNANLLERLFAVEVGVAASAAVYIIDFSARWEEEEEEF